VQPCTSARPTRVCSRRSGAGAYHAARPSIRWQAGTSTARARAASIMTANPAPMPNSCRKLTVALPMAKNCTAISTAAGVTMRPLRVSPSVTAVWLSRPRSLGLPRDEELPGPERLPQPVAEFERDAATPTSIKISGDQRALDPDARLTVDRAAQEALTNVRK